MEYVDTIWSSSMCRPPTNKKQKKKQQQQNTYPFEHLLTDT